MAVIEIPLKGGAANAHQTQYVQAGDNLLELRLNYITRFPGWSMDVYHNDDLKMAGVMLVPGAEISETYHAGLGRFFFIGKEPTLNNLGLENKLVWSDD